MIITPGMFVRLKHDPSRGGVLENGEKYTAGAQMVEVRFADGQVKWLPYSALEPVPSESENLWDRFAAGRFVEPDWLRRTLTRLIVTGRLSEIVYSMEATETDFYAYQFKPVIKESRILRIEPARRVGSIVLDEGAAIRRRRMYVESAPRPALWLCRDRMNREGMPSKAAERAAGSDWQGPRIGGFKAFSAHRRDMRTSAMAPCGRGRNQQP